MPLKASTQMQKFANRFPLAMDSISSATMFASVLLNILLLGRLAAGIVDNTEAANGTTRQPILAPSVESSTEAAGLNNTTLFSYPLAPQKPTETLIETTTEWKAGRETTLNQTASTVTATVTATPDKPTTRESTSARVNPFLVPVLRNIVDIEGSKTWKDQESTKGNVATESTQAFPVLMEDSTVHAVPEALSTTNRSTRTTLQNFWNVFGHNYRESVANESVSEESTPSPQRRMVDDHLSETTNSEALRADATGSTLPESESSTATPLTHAVHTTAAPMYDMTKERFCTGARYCYKELNERCITRHMKTVCGCGRAFFRNPLTMICERKMSLVSVLELPEQLYTADMADKKSAEYKAFDSAAKHLIWDLVHRSPLLRKGVIDVVVTGFRQGVLVRHKLVVMFPLIRLLEPNVTAAVQREFDREISRYPVATGSILNMTNMNLKAAGLAVNPCEDSDTNFCSPHSICTYHKHARTMSCTCLPSYEDNSPDRKNFAGEICLSICEPGHCQNNGSCKNYGFGIKCECPEWYTGNKCQYHTQMIIIVAAIVCVVLFSACAFVFCKFWRKGRIQKGPTVCRMIIMEPSRQLTGNKLFELRLEQGPPPPVSDLAKSFNKT